MTKLMNYVAIAALTTVSAAPAIAQQAAADPFVSTQDGGALGLTAAQIAAIGAGLVVGVALILDSDGNVVGTTSGSTNIVIP